MKSKACLFLPLAIVLGLALAFGGTASHAQTIGDSWSSPVLLFKSPVRQVDQPIVLADEVGKLYVFWELSNLAGASVAPLQSRLIYYTNWDGKSWSPPVDIIASPQARLASAAVDRSGFLHLLWHSGQLNYSRASVDEAGSARAWTTPAEITSTHLHPQILADGRGWLHRAYPTMGGRGIYYQLSRDGGLTWSFPVNVSPTSSADAAADLVRMAVDDDGRIHIVWTEYRLPTGWPPVGVFYSRSEDDGRNWSPATKLAGEGYDQINVVTAGPNTVHVAWNGMAGVDGRYHRWSSDAGRSWSETSMIVSGGGTEGPPQLAVDRTGTLHVLTTRGDGRVWYISWQNQKWSDPVYVPTGDEAGIPPIGQQFDYTVRHIEEPAMTIGRDGWLHAVFWDLRRQQDTTYVWHTAKRVAPPSPPLLTAAPTASSSSDASRALPAPPVGVSKVVPESAVETQANSWSLTPRSSAFVGVWWAVAVIGLILLLKVVQRLEF